MTEAPMTEAPMTEAPMTKAPMTKDAAMNRLLVASYEHCMSDVAAKLDYVTNALHELKDAGPITIRIVELIGELYAMLAKASENKTVRAGDKVEALLALANGEPCGCNRISAEELQTAVKRAEEAEAALAKEKEKRVKAETEVTDTFERAKDAMEFLGIGLNTVVVD